MKRVRGPARLACVTYPLIARWTGLQISSVRTYAKQGLFNPRDLQSVLCWVNTRRRQGGLPMIGVPPENSEVDTLENATDSVTPNAATTSAAEKVKKGNLLPIAKRGPSADTIARSTSGP